MDECVCCEGLGSENALFLRDIERLEDLLERERQTVHELRAQIEVLEARLLEIQRRGF